ncbi:hypothetical protein P4133_34605 [Pseudomonas aeruginosa]|nr:hypothetical protein [Pseudomonas aeruginosa]
MAARTAWPPKLPVSTALLIGISTEIPAADGAVFDVIRSGLAPVEYGGNVTRGDALDGRRPGGERLPRRCRRPPPLHHRLR